MSSIFNFNKINNNLNPNSNSNKNGGSGVDEPTRSKMIAAIMVILAFVFFSIPMILIYGLYLMGLDIQLTFSSYCGATMVLLILRLVVSGSSPSPSSGAGAGED